MTVDEIRRIFERTSKEAMSDEDYLIARYLNPLLAHIDEQASEIQRLEARIAALTAPGEPSQEAVEWAREEMGQTEQARQEKYNRKMAKLCYEDD